MLPYPKINPNIIEIGPFKLRWYGLMYVLGFVSCYFLIGKQRRARDLGLVGAQLQDLIFSLAIGLILGARLGYVLFYQFSNYTYYLQHPLEIIAIWHGGMSFHGGLIGAVLAGLIFARRRKIPFWEGADAVVVTIIISKQSATHFINFYNF